MLTVKGTAAREVEELRRKFIREMNSSTSKTWGVYDYTVAPTQGFPDAHYVPHPCHIFKAGWYK